MKEKIFNKLKQAYSSLGLGDEILQAHAEALANLGLVTDLNLDTVIGVQKSYLEGLQKSNDKRVSDAVAKAQKKFEEETKAKEEAKKKAAEEEAKKAAEEKAKKEAEEKKKAEEEAAKKAAEEAERKRLEEIRKAEMPEEVKKIIQDAEEQRKAEREKYEELIRQMTENAKAQQSRFDDYVKEQTQKTQTLIDNYNTIRDAAEKAKAEAQQRARQDFILSKAKELDIPQYRIDEGFNIKDEMTDDEVMDYLSKVSANIRAASVPSKAEQHQLGDDKPSKEDFAAIAKSLIK